MPGLGAFGFQLKEVQGDRRIVTTTRSHSNKLVTDCVDAMEPHEVIRVGGAGNKVRWISSSYSNICEPLLFLTSTSESFKISLWQ
ncbi:3'(2'),5'-bisphosphate nucleotidase 1 [Liparis tanakae]|uniref:3'(2'),5'-bisphosphate nucleotidase 1 n=1 Tax=Liparis tanakae TaxID=230148 RepID=A0A4Z2E0E6_9TELE|nr:3'(2'),5'-bisphosphate nucleotidase 1 [Liparis tanakae]